MKKFFTTTIGLFFILYLHLQAATISKIFHYSEPLLESRGEFHFIFMGDLKVTGKAGEPGIPYQSLSLLLPPGHRAIKVKIDPGEEVTLEGSYKLYPMQFSRPISEGGSGIFAFNPQVYFSESVYPAQLHGPLQTHYMNGFAIAMVTFTPVRYVPATGKLSFYRDVKVTVEFEPDRDASEALRNLNTSDKVLQRLKLLVDNPEMISQYPVRESKNTDYDLLIITPSQFAGTFNQLVNFYLPRGILAQVVTTQQIYTSTPGQDNQEKIRNYIISQYQNFGISHVTLAGDVEHVPYRGFYCTVQSSSVYTDNNIPSDLYYSALDGNWNSNGNNLWGEIGEDDLLPEIGVGRMSFSTQAELNAMMNKILNYQGNPVLGELRRPLLAGEHLWDNPLTYGCDYLDLLIGYQNQNGYITNGIPPDHQIEMLCDENGTWSATMLRQKINQGKSFIHHCGHADATYVMRFYSSDITNNNFAQVNGIVHNFTLAYSHGCICGSFDQNDCIGEKMITINNLAAAVVMNSRYGWFNEGQTEGPSAHLHREFVDALYNIRESHIGMTHTISRIKTAPWVNAPGQWEEGALRWCFYCCNVLGESAMRIWSDEPITISANYQNTLPVGVPFINLSFSGNGPVGGLKCTFIKNGVIHGRGTTNSNGQVTIHFDVPVTEVGEAIVYVAGYNCLLHQFPVSVIPNTGAYVVYQSSVVNDIQGNNNGIPEYNESIYLTTTLKNVGSAQANLVTATITSSSPFVNITNASANFGNIPGNGSVTVENAFAFDILPSVPDQHQIPFTLIATGQESWTSYFSITAHAPKLEYQNLIINDSNGGNNNGILDPGETVIMLITVGNAGHAPAYGVTAQLITQDPYVTVQTTTAQNIGNLNPGNTGGVSFNVSASLNTPAGHIATITLLLQAMYGINTLQTITLNFTDYCIPSANCTYGDGFTGFSLGTINNMNSGCSPNGYGNFTAMTTELQAGQSYQVSMKTGYSNQYVCIWIDFNSNKIFEDSERLLNDFQLTNANQIYTTTINIPNSVIGGVKRLRARANWLNSAADPCANFTYGETEDYTVIIPAGTISVNAWSTPQSICQYDTAQLFVNASGGTGFYTYQWFPATGLSNPLIPNPLAYPLQTTTYTVQVSDGMSTSSAQVTVNVMPLPPTPTITLNGVTLTSSSPTGNQWYCSLGAIPGATGQTYTCTWEDVYFVRVTGENGCVSLPSNSIHVILTGLNQSSWSSLVKVHPNPFNDLIRIELPPSDQPVSIYLYHSSGLLVHESTHLPFISPEIIQINTQTFPSGIFYLNIRGRDDELYHKLIKMKR